MKTESKYSEILARVLYSARQKDLKSLCDRSGMAATEFAMILPIMLLMFFGMLEVSDAMMANRRVANAANTLADLVAQETEVSTTDVNDIMLGVQDMLEPTAGSTVIMKIISVSHDPLNANKLLVDWSRDNLGNTPYASGVVYTGINKDIVPASASLIVVEMEFDYVSGLSHKVLGVPIQFTRTVSRWPRQSTSVTLCGNSPLPACS